MDLWPLLAGFGGVQVNVIAVAWSAFEAINLGWPRSPMLPWYQNWSVLLTVDIAGIGGFATYLAVHKRAIDI